MTLDALKTEIGKLSPQERSQLTDWLQQREDEAWDNQIRADFKAGKLDDLISRAKKEFQDGTIREAP